MNQTIVDYGEIRLWNVQTVGFTQEQVLGEGGANVIYSRITIHVIGYIREWDSGQTERGVRSSVVNYTSPLGPPSVTGAVPSSLTGAVTNYRDRVSYPNSLRYIIGAAEDGSSGQMHLFASPYPDGNTPGVSVDHSGVTEWYDCHNGPFCKHFNVLAFHSAHVAKVEAIFEVAIPWCSDFPESPEGVTKIVENQWSVTDSIDKDIYTTRTYSGVLRVANPYLNTNQLRELILPPLVQGMRRQSMQFDSGADMLSLKYTIIDKEATVAAPSPATSFEMVHSDSVGIGKPMVVTNLNITLTGSRNANRKALVQVAIAIAEEKVTGLLIVNGDANQVIMIDDLTITDYQGTDTPTKVQLQIACHRVRDDGAKFNAEKGPFGKLPVGTAFPFGGYDPGPGPQTGMYHVDFSPDPGIEGPISLTGAMRSYFRGVCSADETNAIKYRLPGTDTDPELGAIDEPNGLPTVQSRFVPLVPALKPTYVSVQQSVGIYTHYRLESQWDTHHNRVQLALAQSSADYSSGADSCVVVALGNPRTTRTIRVEAVRLGIPPQIQEPKESYTVTCGPSEDDNSPYIFTLLSKKVLSPVPEKTFNGKDIWTVRADFVYACNRHPKNNEPVPLGIDPSFSGVRKNLTASTLSSYDENETIA